ncbi:MAG: hypothetical protein ABH829_00995 [archaeon]
MYLLILAAVSIVVSALILGEALMDKNYSAILTYLLVGSIIATIDFIIEYIGTFTDLWTYYASLHLIFGKIPVELIFTFFALGLVARRLYLFQIKRSPLDLDTIYYVLIFASIIFFIRGAYSGIRDISLLVIGIPAALWGMHAIRDELKKAKAVILAVVVAVLDVLVEVYIIEQNVYSYEMGFSWSTPFVYGLFAITLMAIMERFDSLDKFFEIKIIEGLVRFVGIKESIRTRFRKKR